MHRLSNIDPEARTAICEECGPVRVKPPSPRSSSWRCKTPHQAATIARNKLKSPEERRSKSRNGIPKADLRICARCGFVAEHHCQIDVHHVDRDRSNNDRANLEVLCANCHRLEHRLGPG